MEFYEVWVASPAFHGDTPLTYGSEVLLSVGQVVLAPLQRNLVIGIVVKKVSKPRFATKNIAPLPVVSAVPKESLQLLEWIRSYYPAPSGQITSLFVPSSLTQKAQTAKANPLEGMTKKTPAQKLPSLTKDQEAALQSIQASEKPVLLHGETATGKTRVYIELTRETLKQGNSALILTPEIGLTPQLVARFNNEFAGQIVVIHSHLTPAQKRDAWLLIAQSSTPLVIIGPRSALFSPIHSLGLVVVDEMHDQAYKQEQAPHYQATRVAAQLAHLHKAKLVLGSATPSVADYYAFEAKGLPIVRMSESAVKISSAATEIQVVDLRERDHFTRSPWFSNQLLQSVTSALNEGSQSLVFLNRRGSARAILCQSCDWRAECPKCDIPLTYHADHHRMRCHTCGYSASPPISCPSCSSTDLAYKSIGTKAITEELTKLFPGARIARFDSDNKKSERLDVNHAKIQEGTVDILVGTQLITKGLDLPRLSTVGIIAADTSLFFPDYTAEELTYQQLHQVVGRVGRGHRAGSVIIQTYYPKSSVINAVVNKNYSLFYKQQISERESFLFPPFSFVLKLTCSRKTEKAAEKACYNLHALIQSLPLSIEIVGPAPCFQEKQNNNFRWQLIIKAKKRTELTQLIQHLPAQVLYDIDPSNLL